MKGNNTLILNSATMVEALQEYFDKRLTPKIKVKSVQKNSSSSNNYTSDQFAVDVTDEVEAKV